MVGVGIGVMVVVLEEGVVIGGGRGVGTVVGPVMVVVLVLSCGFNPPTPPTS